MQLRCRPLPAGSEYLLDHLLEYVWQFRQRLRLLQLALWHDLRFRWEQLYRDFGRCAPPRRHRVRLRAGHPQVNMDVDVPEKSPPATVRRPAPVHASC